MITNADVLAGAAPRTLPVMVKKATTAPSEVARQAGLRLRAVILALDLKVTSLANLLGVKQNTLSNWLSDKNKRMPDQVAMLKLWQHFHVPMEFIYGGETGRMEYGLREKIVAACAQVEAVVGGPVAEWPMQAEGAARPRPPATVPSRRGPRTLHEDAPTAEQ